MTHKVQHVFRVEPYRILQDLEVKVTQDGSRLFAPHPSKPGETMLLDQGSLISTAFGCDIIACSIYDYIRFIKGSYKEAVNFLIEHYQHHAQIPPGTSLAALRPGFIESLKSDRQQFEAVLKMRDRVQQDKQLLPSFLWCRKRGLNTPPDFLQYFPVRRIDLMPFLDPSEQPNLRLEDEHYIVFPYLANPHTFAWLQVYAAESKQEFTLNLNPVKHAFYGLLACTPDVTEIRAYNSALTAQLAFSSETRMSNDMKVACVHVGRSDSSQANDYQLGAAVFIRTPDTTFTQIAQAQPGVEKLTVNIASPKDSSLADLQVAGISWTSYVLSEATRLLQQGLDFELIGLVDVVRYDSNLCDALIRHLEQLSQPNILAKIKKHLNANQTYTLAGMQIVETGNGYLAQRKNASVPFTNFIIRLERNVYFEEDDSNEPIHCGRLVMQDREFPIVIPGRYLGKPAEIPRLCLNALIRCGAAEQEGFFPQILDSTLARRLGDVLKMQTTANKQQCRGVHRLGWNPSRTKFTTPTWETTTRQLKATSRIPHPFSNFLNTHYDFHEYTWAADPGTIPPKANTLLCLLASGLVRSFLHLSVPPVEILRHPRSISLLKAVFLPLGQSQPIPFGGQRRTIQGLLANEKLAGYPIFGIAANVDVVVGTTSPIFLISDSGMSFNEVLDAATYARITGHAYDVLNRLTIFCLRNTSELHLMIQSEDEPDTQQAIHEGKRIIEQCLGIDNFNIFTPQLPTLEVMLRGVPHDRLVECFRYDIPTNCIYIKLRKFESVPRNDLLEELTRLNSKVRRHGKHYIACPADFLFGVLEEFYGRPVKLFHQDPEPEPSDSSEFAQHEEAQSGS